MFGQVVSSASRQAQGTGLGLALCRKFVEMHGGTIGADSVPGRDHVLVRPAHGGSDSQADDLNCRAEPLSFVPMRHRPGRLTSLLLATLLLFHGVALGLLHARATSTASLTATTVSAGQPGTPLPEHDETTCAICHASVTLPALTLSRTVLPDPPAAHHRALPATNDRLPHSVAERPVGTRGPPALRSA